MEEKGVKFHPEPALTKDDSGGPTRCPAHRFAQRVKFSDLSRDYLERLVRGARNEDLAGLGLDTPPLASGDVTSKLLTPGLGGEATLVARESLIACGIPLIPIILQAYHEELSFQPEVEDGDRVGSGQSLGKASGPAPELLMSERVLLNFLQFLSGVATLTRSYIDALGPSTTRLLDTRKTIPGYRMLQKYAVACGGGWNHRLGLFDRAMLKDNHLAANSARSGQALTELVGKARRRNPKLLIELEVDLLAQIPAALKAAPDKVMLDNFTIPQLKRAVALIGGRVCTEATGGVTLDNLTEYGSIGLDFISTGALVHKAVWKDIGLDWNSGASPER